MIQESSYQFKVVLTGSQGVGKSSLFLRFCENVFIENYLTTIGVDFRFKTMDVDGQKCRLQIWDTAGQERFRTIVSAYYRNAQIIIVVFDLTQPQSFSDVEDFWLKEVQGNSSPNTILCLVGNKADSPDAILKPEVETFIAEMGIPFFKVSAKSGEGVEAMMNNLCLKVLEKNPHHIANTHQLSQAQTKERRGPLTKCCRN